MFTVAESGLSKLKGSIYKNIDLSHRLREYIICDFLDIRNVSLEQSFLPFFAHEYQNIKFFCRLHDYVISIHITFP